MCYYWGMIYFLKADADDTVCIGYLRPGRDLAAAVRDRQRGSWRKLTVDAELENLGEAGVSEVQEALCRRRMHGDWYEWCRSIAALLLWAQNNPTAGTAELRKILAELSKTDEQVVTRKKQKLEKMEKDRWDHELTDRRPSAYTYLGDDRECPRCHETITAEEDIVVEAAGEIWHQLCANVDEIVVGEWDGKDFGDLADFEITYSDLLKDPVLMDEYRDAQKRAAATGIKREWMHLSWPEYHGQG